jgi:2-hydroxymuconate-semialdehyde hydrolase
MTTSQTSTSVEEIATIEHGPFSTHYVDRGQGRVVLLLHGSGPGVDAMANWRLVLPDLSSDYRVIAPDIVGFGGTRVDGDHIPDRGMWIDFMVSFLDALNLVTVDVVGNSFGGALALWLASEHPERVGRLVLMGSVGSEFALTPGLDAVWGYEPSPEAMTELLDIFTYDASKLPSSLARVRYEASVTPGSAERYSSLFPAPRQRWIDALALGPERLAALRQPTLLVHGREDRVIPLASSIQLEALIPDAELHVFPFCGHWVQIERAAAFCALVRTHLDRKQR